MNSMAKKTITTTPIAPVTILTGYTLKGTIRVGEYENIQAEISVQSPSIEEAHEYCMNHLKQLFAEYSLNKKKAAVADPIHLEDKPESYYIAFKSISATTDKEALRKYDEKVTKSANFNQSQKQELYDLINKQRTKQ